MTSRTPANLADATIPAGLQIIFECPDILVVNKPAGLVCHPTKGDATSSLVGRLRTYLGHPGHLVHRLDRETSGVVLVAKNPVAAGELARIFENRKVDKVYTAIVHGWLVEQSRLIDAPLGRDEASPVAIKDRVRADGVAAVTEVERVKTFVRAGAPFSVVRALPASGRKHQIRIHLAHIGHAIVGDKIYGGDEMIYLRFVQGQGTGEDQSRMMLPYQALHAGVLRFQWRDQEWAFEAPIPAAMAGFQEAAD